MTGPDIAPLSHPKWRQLASSGLSVECKCLALKLMMVRIRIAHGNDPGQIDRLAAEIRDFFVANFRFAADDYRAIFAGTK